VATAGELDRKALADQKFEAALSRSVGETLGRRAKKDGIPAFDELDADQQLEALEKLYEDLTGSEPELADVKAPEGKSRREARDEKRKLEVEQLRTATRKKVQVERSELEALGRKRGEAIEAALIKGGKLDASRVLLSKDGKVTAEKSKVRYELDLK
jgi:hypothetical protein